MSKSYETIKNFFARENIDSFSAIKSDNLSVINERIMPENVKSCVMFFIPYYTGKHENRNVSLYSVSLDYHLYIKELSARFEGDNEHYFKFFADTSPINERAAAIDAGLGFVGQNGLLISEKYGSYVFIGTLLTDAEFDEDEYTTAKEKKSCIGCGLCKKNCAFLRGERDFCLSELTQRKNVTDEELEVIKNHPLVWGCDTCQEVCPNNRDVSETPIEFFRKDLLERIDAEMIENMSKDEFSKRAYAWRGKKTILRNLQVDNSRNT